MTWNEDLPRIDSERIHSCDSGERLRAETAAAQSAEAKEALWGHVITRIERVDGRWWAHNEENSARVEFCPWRGAAQEP
ncbi:hypothetical protein BH23GEM6_BH23GEM6_12420 [soil metagenome]